MEDDLPEPWLRGPINDVHPLVMPLFFTFSQVVEDLAKHTAGLAREQVWRKVDGASLGFHLKHIPGTVDRLITYLMGEQLSAQQLQALKQESEGEESLDELLRLMEETIRRAEDKLRHLDPQSLYEARSVGRRALPTTVIGLIVHLAEHTQRHLGQAITTSKLLRQPDSL
ncbi:MAG: DinB family protein [Acidobacteriaceae bacterium]|nr:DinB family protein [Acidobacteriaceae bacterium]